MRARFREKGSDRKAPLCDESGTHTGYTKPVNGGSKRDPQPSVSLNYPTP